MRSYFVAVKTRVVEDIKSDKGGTRRMAPASPVHLSSSEPKHFGIEPVTFPLSHQIVSGEEIDRGNDTYRKLGEKRPGGIVELSDEQVEMILDRAEDYVVRWTCARSPTTGQPVPIRSAILDRKAASVRSVGENKWEQYTPRFREAPNDEPLAKYLVMLPASSRVLSFDELNDLPSLADRAQTRPGPEPDVSAPAPAKKKRGRPRKNPVAEETVQAAPQATIA